MNSRSLLHTIILGLGLSALASIPALAAGGNHYGNWWDPADDGWGLATIDQGNVMGSYWFAYDEQGRPSWFMGVGLPQEDGSYAGDLYRFHGTPFQDIDSLQANEPAIAVGQIQFEFGEDPRAMRFTTLIDGQSVGRDLTRFNFGGKDLVCDEAPADRSGATNYTDLWWEPESSGWGINVLHLDEVLYGQWYTYEEPGHAVFMTLDLKRQSDGSYAGDVHRQKDGGRPFKSVSAASSQPGGEIIGSASLVFLDGQTAEFDYVVGTSQGHHRIQRMVVGDRPAVCSVAAWDDAEEEAAGEGELCWPAYHVGDERHFYSESSGGGALPIVGERIERTTGPATFKGHSGLVTEHINTDGKTYGKIYNGNDDEMQLLFGTEAVDPDTGAVITTTTNDPVPVVTPRRFVMGETLAIDYLTHSTTVAGNLDTDIKTTYRLVGMERITVPAGSFDACKIEQTTDMKATGSVLSGGSIHSLRSGHIWLSPQFGPVRLKFTGTTTTRVAGFSMEDEDEILEELLHATINGVSTPN